MYSSLIRCTFSVTFTVLCLILCSALISAQEESPYQWIYGPTTVEMGDDVARLELGPAYQFADAAMTQALLEAWGNVTDGSEVGAVFPRDTLQNWVLIFEWDPIGYVNDDDKDEIDADAILESYKEGTEQNNAHRIEMGLSPLHITGWFEAPRYDEDTNNLVWALLVADETGAESVNHNTRLLGREGYMSVTIIGDPEELSTVKHEVNAIMTNFSYKDGKRYLDFVQGDKVAEYGLVALIAGGTGLAAAKLGLFAWLAKSLAKFGKAILIGLVAVGAAIKKFFFGGSKSESRDA